jgi:hypothetical protein
MLAKVTAFLRYVAGAVGLFIGLSLINTNLNEAVAITALTTVGLVGTISFFSHFIFHAEDAKIVKLKAKGDDFQFEVGFANLAFGLTAIASYVLKWGIVANTVLILAFSIYLFQAGILHSTRALGGKKKDIAHFVRGGLVTFIYCALMLYVVFRAITSGSF